MRGPPFIRRFIAMCASGVLPSSFATGVGNKPDAVAAVRGAKGRSRKAVPLRVIPARGQVSENTSKPLVTSESWDVLHDDVSGSKLANDPSELGPKTRALTVDASLVASDAEVLAGEASADEVDGGEVVCSDRSHVFESLGVGEVLGEYGSAVGVELDLPEGAHSGSLEAEVEAADPCEERADREGHVTAIGAIASVAIRPAADRAVPCARPAPCR